MGRSCNLTPEIKLAYAVCQKIARTHYENFPVASILLPKHLRRSIAAIYAFARTADDVADEGDLSQEMRLEQMTKLESQLYDIQYGKPPTEPLFIALKHTIECFNLPLQLFYDLLTAFRQDILKNSYQNFYEVDDYCHYSANPIGRLLLYLTGQASPENLLLSDHICTGLQLINFIQDIHSDLLIRNRCYIPVAELEKYHVTLQDIADKSNSHNYAQLIQQLLAHSQKIYCKGVRLGHSLPGLFGLEIRFIIACGNKLLDKLNQRKNVWQRPLLSKIEMLFIFLRVIIKPNNSKFAFNCTVLDKI